MPPRAVRLHALAAPSSLTAAPWRRVALRTADAGHDVPASQHGAAPADTELVMVKTEPGFSTCREHGGEYAGDLGAIEHLQAEHPDLWRMLSGAVMVPIPEDGQPPAPNRAQRRAKRERGRDRRRS